MTTKSNRPRPARGMTARGRGAPTLGAQLIVGLEEALAYERGTLAAATTRVPVTARAAQVAPPPVPGAGGEIAAPRATLGFSQPVFARALNVSPETVGARDRADRRIARMSARVAPSACGMPDMGPRRTLLGRRSPLPPTTARPFVRRTKRGSGAQRSILARRVFRSCLSDVRFGERTTV